MLPSSSSSWCHPVGSKPDGYSSGLPIHLQILACPFCSGNVPVLTVFPDELFWTSSICWFTWSPFESLGADKANMTKNDRKTDCMRLPFYCLEISAQKMLFWPNQICQWVLHPRPRLQEGSDRKTRNTSLAGLMPANGVGWKNAIICELIWGTTSGEGQDRACTHFLSNICYEWLNECIWWSHVFPF